MNLMLRSMDFFEYMIWANIYLPSIINLIIKDFSKTFLIFYQSKGDDLETNPLKIVILY